MNQLPPASWPLTGNLFRSELSTFLIDFHQQHIFNHPHFGYEYGPSVSLLAVIQTTDTKEVAVFRTDQTTVVGVGEHGFIGVGAAMALSIVEPLIIVSLSRMAKEDVLLLADHMLHQVKRFVPGCGDRSQFFYVSSEIGFCGIEPHVLLPEERSATWQRIVADLFYASANLDLDDESVSIGMTLTDRRIQEIRREQRAERDRRLALGPKLFTSRIIGIGPDPIKYVPRPLASNNPEDQQ